MGTLFLVILFGVVGILMASKSEQAVPCESGEFTNSGECCQQCPPGEGVETQCGATQTVCSQCQDSESYSEVYSHTEGCRTCTACTGLMRMHTPCTDASDAVCVCDYNYYLGEVSGACEPCTLCPAGRGVLAQCRHERDTECEACEEDTYSARDSSLDPCLPCVICDEAEEELSACTPVSDAICHNPLFPHYMSPTTPLEPSPPSITDGLLPDGSSSPTPGAETTTARPGYPRFIEQGFNENLIPIYCSILAAVVVGLVAYIVFKRWNSCKQNKQPANNRQATAANQTVTPEGEKLHSDSGISVDSQSLQEQLHAAQAQVQTQPLQPAPRPHGQEQIVVRVDEGPDSPLPQV